MSTIQHEGVDKPTQTVSILNADGTVASITGGAGGDASASNQEALIALIGDVSDAAWDGTSPDATVIALLKRIALNTDTA